MAVPGITQVEFPHTADGDITDAFSPLVQQAPGCGLLGLRVAHAEQSKQRLAADRDLFVFQALPKQSEDALALLGTSLSAVLPEILDAEGPERRGLFWVVQDVDYVAHQALIPGPNEQLRDFLAYHKVIVRIFEYRNQGCDVLRKADYRAPRRHVREHPAFGASINQAGKRRIVCPGRTMNRLGRKWCY